MNLALQRLAERLNQIVMGCVDTVLIHGDPTQEELDRLGRHAAGEILGVLDAATVNVVAPLHITPLAVSARPSEEDEMRAFTTATAVAMQKLMQQLAGSDGVYLSNTKRELGTGRMNGFLQVLALRVEEDTAAGGGMTYLGIDPGQTGGGLAIVGDDHATKVWKMPAEADDIARLIRNIESDYSPEQAILEWVGPMPGQGISSTYNFGRNVGRLEASVHAFRIPLIVVVPRKWQKHYFADGKPKSMPKDEWKRVLKAEAARRFPEIRVTRYSADALLLADYGRHLAGA